MELRDELITILQTVIDWLKFAEAKNAIIVTVNGGLIFGYLTVFSSKITFDKITFFSMYSWELVGLSALGLLVALLSFFPQTKDVFWYNSNKKEGNENLLFWGDIQKYSEREYLKALSPEQKDFSRLELDYAKQIINNSQIAYRKYEYFKWAVFLTVSAIATVVVGVLLLILFNPNND